MWHGTLAQVRYSLNDVIRMARDQSPFSKQAETRKENRYWQYRQYKSNYNPQLRLSGQTPNYREGYSLVTQPSGQPIFQQYKGDESSFALSLDQPIFFTGGNVSIYSDLTRVYNHNFTKNKDTIQWGGQLYSVRITQPVFTFNQLRWDKKTEPLRYEESKREFVEELESISQQAANRFFSVLDAQIGLQIAEFNLANNDTIYKIEQGRYNIGTTTRDKLLQAELQLLRSQQDVTAAKIKLENDKLSLRSYIGLREDASFELVLPEEIPPLVIDKEEALRLAHTNRADFIAFERRKLEAEREVAQARSQRFEMDVSASFGKYKQSNQLLEVYNPENPSEATQVSTFISFNMPVVDWGRTRARMRTAEANKRLNDYVIAQDEALFDQEIITQVRQFEVLLSQIEITRKSDEVAQERYVVSQNRYLVGKIDITNLNIALTEKDAAKRSYLSALREFWTAYYELRRLTLYDFSTNELLYIPDGEE